MKVFAPHLKAGGCPKGSREVRKGKFHRCKINGRRAGMSGHGMYGKKRR